MRCCSINLRIVLGILTVVCKGEAYPDGFTNSSAPHHSRNSVPHTMTGGIGEDLDGFPNCSVPYVTMDEKMFVVTAVLGGVKIRGSRRALGDQWQNCSMVAQGFLVIAHLPSREHVTRALYANVTFLSGNTGVYGKLSVSIISVSLTRNTSPVPEISTIHP